jgi:hypothetical protein
VGAVRLLHVYFPSAFLWGISSILFCVRAFAISIAASIDEHLSMLVGAEG